jgi:diguanylate cyclase (GGDEF)-like protein
MSALVVVVAAVAAVVAHIVGYAAGRLVGATGRARLAAALAAARRQACTDPLTGLGNRAALSAELAARASRGEPYALLLLDLDGFKPVNDVYGHAAGDAVLAEIGRRLAAMAAPCGFAARLGGDEFVLIAPVVVTVVGPVPAVRRLAHDVVRVVARPVRVGGQDLTVAASVGIAYALPGTRAGTASSMAPHEVLHRADVAMYRAKTGRLRVVEDTHPNVCAGQGSARPAARLRDMPDLVAGTPAGTLAGTAVASAADRGYLA